jgi:hypothetical protein
MKERILRHLMYFGTITSWEAIKEYNCTRLSHYIYLPKKDGHTIIGETEPFVNKFGEKSHFTRYRLEVCQG